MSSVNNLLYSVQNMAPALLNIGAASKSNNYDSLAAINSSLFGTNSTSSTNSWWNDSSSSSSSTDKVSLTYKNIGQKVVTDMATVTADTIKQYPELDKDYVIAIIDDGTTREARVYRRSEILANFEGTEKEKKALENQLATEPLMVFSNGNGLPESASDKASQALTDNLNAFLKKNNGTLNTVSKAGYDAFADALGSSTMKKILANCASTEEVEETLSDKDLSKKLLNDLMDIIDAAVKSESSLKDDYVVAIIDDGVTREASIYSRSDILDNFEGTEEQKKELEEKLAKNPVMVYSSDSGLPESASGTSFEKLASAINGFLKENSKDLDKLDKAGYDPLANLLGDTNIRKMLVNYASSLITDDDE
ncbi:hypothetical protein C4J81_10635 [Deltaproteobacteria bacterium Smac51]|nr:hypothetical protein C4J81_10635 [Deltaproteobacteria bacterium Smac51]